jgi:cytochrome P450
MSDSYLLNHPAHVEHVLQVNYRNYRKSPIMTKVKPVLCDRLFLNEGELWTQQRKLVASPSHRQRVEAMGAIMVDVIKEHVARWSGFAKSGENINLSEDMSFLALGVALRTMFGSGMDSHEARSFAATLAAGNAGGAEPKWDVPHFGESLPIAKNKSYDKAVKTLSDVVWRMIQERRSANERKDDLLGVLIDARDSETNAAMDDQQLRDEVLSLLLVGHEATATTLAWAIHYLAQHPGDLERLRDEVDAILEGGDPDAADIKLLEYSKRVIQEVARLRPSISWFARVAIADDNIAGQPIKAGTTVLISQYLIHHDPAIWEDPTVFNPDRFLPEKIARRPKFAYLPFGAGLRASLGSGFTTMEIQMALALLLRRFDVQTTVPDEDPDVSTLAAQTRATPITARIRPRRAH